MNFLFSDQGKIPLALLTTMKKLKSGYINGTRYYFIFLPFIFLMCMNNPYKVIRYRPVCTLSGMFK